MWCLPHEKFRSVISILSARNINQLKFTVKFVIFMENINVLSESIEWKWVRFFNEGQENVHDDTLNGWQSLLNEDVSCAVNGKSKINNYVTFLAFFTNFIFMKLSEKLHQKLCAHWVPWMPKWNDVPVCWLFWFDTVSKLTTSWVTRGWNMMYLVYHKGWYTQLLNWSKSMK